MKTFFKKSSAKSTNRKPSIVSLNSHCDSLLGKKNDSKVVLKVSPEAL